jgi:hypothetical protein
MVMCSRLSPRSFHHQHRALGELHDTIRPTSDHSLVQCRVACRPDDEQIDLELGCELNDIAHRMAGEPWVYSFTWPSSAISNPPN